MVDIATRPAFVPRLPYRLLIAAALLIALVATIALIGSKPTNLPAPFGPARNGLIVYAVDGDIFTADPETGRSSPLVSGPDVDRGPLVSPDGTRVVFRRGAPGTVSDDYSLAVTRMDGGGLIVLAPEVSENDRVIWSPDSRSVLLNVDLDGRLLRYDVAGGEPSLVSAAAGVQPDAFRPPAGDLILIEAPSSGRLLQTIRMDGAGATNIYEIPAAEVRDGCDFGGIRWSPDGTRIAFLRSPEDGAEGCRIFVMNADGSNAHQVTTTPGAWTETDFRWSPDGTMLAFDRWQQVGSGQWVVQPLGVVSSDGGEVRSIGPTTAPEGAAFEWSPDGRAIISLDGNSIGIGPIDMALPVAPILIDVATGDHRVGSWSMNSWPTWQRLAP